MQIEGKTVLVAGTGVSGLAAARLLNENNIKTILYDSNANKSKREVYASFDEIGDMQLVFGELDDEILDSISLAVLSPGIPLEQPFVQKIKNRNIPVWGEIELAYYFEKGTVIGITGTNGKTTTTTLVGEIMKAYCEKVFVVGNIGLPYTSQADKTDQNSITVAEISSFQLETICDYRPHISAILNITPDHLNRHHTFENYCRAKFDITKNQGEDDVCVLNYDNDETRMFGEDIMHTDVLFFSRKVSLENGICLGADHDTIVYRTSNSSQGIVKVSSLKLMGKHNVENVMAAIGIAISMNVPVEVIRKVVCAFTAVEHRIEYVTEKNNVKYYNDSKGTNPDAAIKAIEAMVRPTVLIAGGYDKKSEYDEWIAACTGKVKALILIGATAKAIEAAARRYDIEDVTIVETLEDAVVLASKKAAPKDAVLLSPACASWDMFTSYEERGKLFKEYVHKLPDMV